MEIIDGHYYILLHLTSSTMLHYLNFLNNVTIYSSCESRHIMYNIKGLFEFTILKKQKIRFKNNNFIMYDLKKAKS
jgi:hypothetical protein